jgi:hypothetical protein
MKSGKKSPAWQKEEAWLKERLQMEQRLKERLEHVGRWRRWIAVVMLQKHVRERTGRGEFTVFCCCYTPVLLSN